MGDSARKTWDSSGKGWDSLCSEEEIAVWWLRALMGETGSQQR